MLPIRFECDFNGHKVYVSILQQFKQHYTGKDIYRVRFEHDDGDVDELLRTDAQMKKLLECRVEVAE